VSRQVVWNRLAGHDLPVLVQECELRKGFQLALQPEQAHVVVLVAGEGRLWHAVGDRDQDRLDLPGGDPDSGPEVGPGQPDPVVVARGQRDVGGLGGLRRGGDGRVAEVGDRAPAAPRIVDLDLGVADAVARLRAQREVEGPGPGWVVGMDAHERRHEAECHQDGDGGDPERAQPHGAILPR
jgi:hypothetical protein